MTYLWNKFLLQKQVLKS